MTGRGNFSLSIDAFVAKTQANADTVLRKVSLSIVRELVLESPVDKGMFRGAWSMHIDDAPYKPASGVTPDKTGTATIQAAAAVLGGLRIGHAAVITNDTPYGPMLEFGGYPNPPKNPTGKTQGGYSIQAPQGFVRLTVARWQDFLNKAAEEVQR